MSQGMEQSVRLNLGVATPGVAVAGNVAIRNFGDLVAGGDLGVESPSGYLETDVRHSRRGEDRPVHDD